MNVLSLFDGLSCGQIALKSLGVRVDNYYAIEIDKYAIEQTQANFPDTVQLGDVTTVKAKDLPKIDLLIGGSPCTDFSFAGKRKGMSTESNELITTLDRYLELKNNDFSFVGQSYLFWEYIRLLKEVKPAYFLLENVLMDKKWEAIITEQLGIMSVEINSSLLSAQNRKRLYWSNIKTRPEGLFGDLQTDIPQPKDRGILLKDILQPESEIDDKYYIKNIVPNFEGMDINNKCGVIKNHGELKEKNNKSQCIDANYHKGIDNHGQRTAVCVAMRGRNPDNSSDRTPGASTEQRLEPKTDGKTNCLTSVQKDNLVMTKNYVQWDTSGKGYKSQQDRAFYKHGKHGKHGSLANARAETKNGVLIQKPRGFNKGGVFDKKSPTLTSNSFEHNNHIKTDYKLRRLTPIECARLQTIPESYRWVVSDSQVYKQLGNGWTIEVIKHIFSFLPQAQKLEKVA